MSAVNLKLAEHQDCHNHYRPHDGIGLMNFPKRFTQLREKRDNYG